MSTLEIIDPATEEAFATLDDVDRAGAAAAVDAAAEAAAGWAATPPRARSEVLRRAFELMHERADSLAETITRENGKPIAEARGEVVYAAEFYRWFSEEAVRLHGTVVEAPGGGGKQVVLNQPVGISYLITPWNFPAAMLTRKVGPALAAGERGSEEYGSKEEQEGEVRTTREPVHDPSVCAWPEVAADVPRFYHVFDHGIHPPLSRERPGPTFPG